MFDLLLFDDNKIKMARKPGKKERISGWVLLFDDNKIKMARKPGKEEKEYPVGCTGEGKR